MKKQSHFANLFAPARRVSAVIEMPGGFLAYLAREKSAEPLSVATLSIPKRSYE